MNRREILKYLFYVVLSIFIIVLILIPADDSEKDSFLGNDIIKGTITKELEYSESQNGDYIVKNYKYLAVVTDGKFKDQVIEVEDNVSDSATYHIPAEVGDDILIYPEISDDNTMITRAYLSNFRRDKWIRILLILFIGLILVVGRMKGVKSLISLGVTLLLVIKVFLPRVIIGQDPIALAIFVAALITVTTMVVISGINKKSLVAVIGTLGGVLFGALVAIFVSYQAKIIGFTYSEAQQLLMLPQGTDFNFNGLLFAAILLGTLGAVMDVAMSISSAIFELKSHNPTLRFRQLFSSGMNIGRDVMGTMINTLILAYVGSSMQILMIILAYNIEFYNIINNDTIVTEVVRAFAGTSGLIIAVPLTAVAAAMMNNE